MKNNNRKKGGLVLLGISLLLSLIGMKETKALDLSLKNEQPFNYTYTNNGKQYPFYLATNIEDNLPIFQERGNASFVDTSTYIKRNERLFMEPFELNALYLTTNGEKASLENLDKRLAMQLYIFENFAKSNKDTISFSFDTNKYHQISDELLKQGQEMIEEKKFSYEVKQGEWTYIPKEWEGKYHIDDNCPFEIREEEDGFYIRGNRLGKFTTDIDIEDYKEDGYYFDSNHPTRSNYTEVLKPCTALTTLEINVVPPIFNIHFPSNQEGYDLEIATESLKNEQVVYNFKVHDDYDLNDFSITKKDGTKLDIVDNSFTMPNEDVYINVDVTKKTHNIKIANINGVIIDCIENAKVGEEVKINVKVLEGYELIKLYVNEKELSIDNLTFTMPNEDVTIKADVTKKTHNIKIDNIKGVIIDCIENAKVGEEVKINVKVLEGYELIKLYVNEKELSIDNLTFTMPNEDVTIKPNIAKKTYNIENKIKEIVLNIPSTAKYNELVKFNIENNIYYEIESLSIIDENNNEIKIENNSFIMPASNITINAKIKEKKYKVSFIDELTNTPITDDIYVKAGNFEIPFFYDYLYIKIYNSDEDIEVLDNNYFVDQDITFVYSEKIEDLLYGYDEYEPLNNENYNFEGIPNTYESGFEPLFGLLALAVVIFFKKYLVA